MLRRKPNKNDVIAALEIFNKAPVSYGLDFKAKKYQFSLGLELLKRRNKFFSCKINYVDLIRMLWNEGQWLAILILIEQMLKNLTGKKDKKTLEIIADMLRIVEEMKNIIKLKGKEVANF